MNRIMITLLSDLLSRLLQSAIKLSLYEELYWYVIDRTVGDILELFGIYSIPDNSTTTNI